MGIDYYPFLLALLQSSEYKGMLLQNEATTPNIEMSLGVIALYVCSFGAI